MWCLQLTYRKVFTKDNNIVSENQNLGFFCFKSKEDANYLLDTYYNLQNQRGIIQIHNEHECEDYLADNFAHIVTDYYDLVRTIEKRKYGYE